MTKAVAYVGLVLAAVAGLSWFAGLFFTGPDNHRAILTSAGIAVVVQVVGFTIAWRMRRSNLLAGWALGALLCMVTLVLYGMAVKPLGLPLEPALLSLAGFFFVTELLEPPCLA
jgi:hypothetical protein